MRIHKLHIIFLLAGILVSGNTLASKIDTIYFQSGDRMTAEVKQLENNQLKLSTDDAGTIYVEWNKIDSVEILNSMRIVLSGGRIIYGKLLTAGEVGLCYIWSSADEPILMELRRIVALAPMEEKFFDRLSGSFSSGFSYVKASQVAQLNFDGSIKYQAEKNSLELFYSGLFSQDPTSGYSQNQSGGATAVRLLPKKWFVLSQLTMESNSEMDLDLRTSITAAGGNAFIRTNRSFFYGALGIMGNREISLGVGQFNLEGLIASEYSVFIFDSPEVSFTLSADVIPSFTTLGRVRTNIDSNMKWEIFSDFYLKWTFYYNYDSQPLSEDAEKNDWSVTLIGVEYKL